MYREGREGVGQKEGKVRRRKGNCAKEWGWKKMRRGEKRRM